MSEKVAGSPGGRRSELTTNQDVTRPAPKRSAKEMDSACYRLSQSNPNKAPPLEKNESYISKYYKQHPDAVVDKNTPAAKLDGITNQLTDDAEMEYKEKLELLVKQKALNFIIYGESSMELLKSIYQLGYHYHHNERPASAIRHLTKARQMQSSETIQQNIANEPDLPYNIDIECAESFYDNALLLKTQRDAKPRDISSNLYSAFSIASKIQEQNDSDKDFRVTILKAHVCNAQTKYQNASQFFDSATQILKKQSEDKSTEHIADIMAEHAANDEKIPVEPKLSSESDFEDSSSSVTKPQMNPRAAVLYYDAFNMYQELGLTGKADALRPKIPDNIEEIVQQEKERKEDEAQQQPSTFEAQDMEEPPEETFSAENEKSPSKTPSKVPTPARTPSQKPSAAKTPSQKQSQNTSTKVSQKSSAKQSQNPSQKASATQSPRERQGILKIGDQVKEKAEDIVDEVEDDVHDDDNFETKESDDFETNNDDNFEVKEDDNNFEVKDDDNNNFEVKDDDNNFEVKDEENNFEVQDDNNNNEDNFEVQDDEQPTPENPYTPITTEENPKFKVDKTPSNPRSPNPEPAVKSPKSPGSPNNFEMDDLEAPLPDMDDIIKDGVGDALDNDVKNNNFEDPLDNELNFEDDFN